MARPLAPFRRCFIPENSILDHAAAIRTWDLAGLRDGRVTALRLSESCLHLLSAPSAPREALTHASGVLVNMAVALWKSSGLWPLEAAPDTRCDGLRASITESEESSSHRVDLSVLDRSLGVRPANLAASLMGHPSGQPGTDEVRALVLEFVPLPPESVLALCRALLHTVGDSVLLSSCESWARDGKTTSSGVCLFAGPILEAILEGFDAAGGVQLRFKALQVGWPHRYTNVKELCARGSILSWLRG